MPRLNRLASAASSFWPALDLAGKHHLLAGKPRHEETKVRWREHRTVEPRDSLVGGLGQALAPEAN